MTGLRKILSIAEFEAGTPAELAVTVGNFDGLHLGHRAVLERLREVAGETDRRSLAVTFDPHPLAVVAPGSAPSLLTPLDERLGLMEEAGVASVLVMPFTSELASESATEFLASIGVGPGSYLVLGYDFHMGRDRSSGIDALRTLGDEAGFEVDVVEPVLFGGEPVSSSRIRALIAKGEVVEAASMLGRPYELSGAVVRGDEVGRTLAAPTANLRTHALKLLPGDGVYYAESVPDGLPAALYVGTRPTFGGRERRVEVHLLDVTTDLYGEELGVAVHGRIRDDAEMRSPSELRERIALDIETVRRMARDRGRKTGGVGLRQA